MTRRDWFQVHSWVGLTAGLLLFVVCWSGTVAVFSREIDRMLAPGAQVAAVEGPMDWDRAHAALAQAAPGWTLTQLNAPYRPGYPAEAWGDDADGVMRRAYLDPATGQVTALTGYFNVQRFFRSFHMALFLTDWRIAGAPLGYWVIGAMGAVLLASLASGLVFYRRWWRGFWALELGKGRNVFWSGLHKLAGLWSLWFIALIGVTGLWYLAEWYTPRSPEPPALPALAAPAGPLPSLAAMVAAGEGAYPGFTTRAVAFFHLPDGPLELHGQDGSLLVRDRAAKVWLDPRDGAVLGIQRPGDLTPYQRWIDTADPVHFGDFGGLWSKWVWFLFGLALSGMALTGAYLQAERQRGARGPQALRRPVALAYGVTVAVLLLSAAFGVQEIRGYGRVGGAPGWPEVPVGVWAFILAWVASTLAVLTLWMRRLR